MHQTFFKHERETAVEYRAKRKTERKGEEAKCYEQVNARDDSFCRVSGAFLRAGADEPRFRREHHHMEKRSKGGQHLTANVVTINAFLHHEIHAGKARLSGDADLRDVEGKLCGVKYERLTESGWETVGYV